MIWIVASVIYWIIGLTIVHKSGWTNDFATNIKLGLVFGLGWPFMLILDRLK